MTTPRLYYALHSYMGLDYSLDSQCWIAYAFASQASRAKWVHKNEYCRDTGNYVARAGTRREAYQVAGINSIHRRASIDLSDQRLLAAWA